MSVNNTVYLYCLEKEIKWKHTLESKILKERRILEIPKEGEVNIKKWDNRVSNVNIYVMTDIMRERKTVTEKKINEKIYCIKRFCK